MLIAVPVFLVELVSAWATIGTYDIAIFRTFAESVARVGPIEIYSLPLGEAGLMVYNHAPLTGWWLMIVNGLESLGIDPRATIRMANSLAHLTTVFLVLALLRRRVAERWAVLSAVAVAVSPVLAIIAGFHGNNDPAVAMFTIASVYLLVDRRLPVWAGVAFAVGLSIKIVPVVALPVLLVAAWGLGRRRDLLRFVLGGFGVFLLLWAPVLVLAGEGFIANVLGYDGSGYPRQWGLYQIGVSLGVPDRLLEIYAGSGAYLVLAISALLPAWLVRRQPRQAPAGLALALVLFLVLTPGWAPQYTAYAAAAVFLIGFWPGIIFTACAGLVYLALYLEWRTEVLGLNGYQKAMVLVVWLWLVVSAVIGVRALFRRSSETDRPGRPARSSTRRRGADDGVPAGQPAAAAPPEP